MRPTRVYKLFAELTSSEVRRAKWCRERRARARNLQVGTSPFKRHEVGLQPRRLARRIIAALQCYAEAIPFVLYHVP